MERHCKALNEIRIELREESSCNYCEKLEQLRDIKKEVIHAVDQYEDNLEEQSEENVTPLYVMDALTEELIKLTKAKMTIQKLQQSNEEMIQEINHIRRSLLSQ